MAWSSWRRLAIRLVLALPLLAVMWPAGAAEDFYKDKQIQLIISTPPGGIYDIYARLMAEHMPKHIAGKPHIVVQNMPGAAGITLANHMFNAAPRDGTVLASTHSGIPIAPLMFSATARFDATKLGWLGSITTGPFVGYVWHSSPIRTLDDLKTAEGIMGGSAVGTTSVNYALIAREVLGLKLRVITGYPNSGDIKLAMERGEIHGTFGNGWSDLVTSQPTWIKEGKIRVIIQHGMTPIAELPGVPLFINLAKTEADRQMLALVLAPQEFSKPYFVPPEVPAERLALLRRAFTATLKDPAFLEAARKVNAPVDGPMNGEELAAMAAKLAATPAPVVKRLEEILAKFSDTGKK